jgi:multidrug resistance efflux pump
MSIPTTHSFNQYSFQQRPGFLIRWGLSLFAIIVLLAGVVCWFIQYPEMVRCNARLTGENMPREITTRVEARLTSLLVKENESVKAGQLLAVLQTIANPQAILQLEQLSDSLSYHFQKSQNSEIVQAFNQFQQFSLSQHDALGEIQGSFQQFMQAYISFCSYHGNGFYGRRQQMIQRDIAFLNQQQKWLQQQEILMQEDIKLAGENFEAYKRMANEKVIAPVEYRNESAKYLSKQMLQPQWESGMVDNQSRQWEKEKETMQVAEDTRTQYRLFIQALQTLRADIAQWKLQFLLVSPVNGTFSYSSFFAENQMLKPGTLLGWVSTPHAAWYAELVIPQYNFGRVSLNQKVLLRLPAYPHEQFGMLQGSISEIKPIATDSGFLARVLLPASLQTTFHHQIPFRQGLAAEADIITANQNLLERFYWNAVRNLRR